MSAVHETLNGSENLSEIDLKSYLTKVTTSVFNTFSTDSSKIKLNSDIDESPISLNQAYPLGLVINELISNSLKYAFPKDKTGEITVKMKKLENKFELIVSDDGIGVPDGFDWRKTNTLGLQLVRDLVEKQLKGTIDLESEKDTSFTIKIPLGT
jgi:two-component sensor histidine kinase